MNMKKLASMVLCVLLVAFVCSPVSAAGYKVITEPQYNMAEPVKNGITKVSKNSKWALADINGEPITDFQWEAIGDLGGSFIAAKKDGKWGYLSPSGTTKILYQYGFASSFHEGLALVQNLEGKYSYINTSGKLMFDAPFTCSFALSEGAICVMLDDLYGYCDTEGILFIQPKYEMAYDFHEGYAAVKKDGKWGYINSYGEYSVKPAYDSAGDFQNGFAVCRLGNKYGIINVKGVRTSLFTFDYIGTPDENGWYPAKAGENSGYINANGQWTLKTPYDYCYKYTEGIARVYKDGLWGYIDKQGNELVAPTLLDCGEYYEDRAPFSTDGSLWGYLTLDKEPPVATPPAEPEPAPENPENAPAQEENKDSEDIFVTQNPASNNTPLLPDGNNCISLKIGSKTAFNKDAAYTLSSAPMLINGITMIPVRDVVRLLGGSIAWNERSQKVSIGRNYKKVILTIGSTTASTMDGTFTLQQAPMLIDGVTHVPLRSVSDGLGCTIKWNDMYQNIYIYYE